MNQKFAKQAKDARNINKARKPAKSTMEATILVEGVDAPIIRCKAQKTFTKGRVTVQKGQAFFLVRSQKFASRYYVVVWSETLLAWQCSCYCVCSKSEHITIVNEWLVDHVVSSKREQDPIRAKVRQAVEELGQQEIADPASAPAPRTKEEWKAALERQKEADRKYRQEYLRQAKSLREIA